MLNGIDARAQVEQLLPPPETPLPRPAPSEAAVTDLRPRRPPPPPRRCAAAPPPRRCPSAPAAPPSQRPWRRRPPLPRSPSRSRPAAAQPRLLRPASPAPAQHRAACRGRLSLATGRAALARMRRKPEWKRLNAASPIFSASSPAERVAASISARTASTTASRPGRSPTRPRRSAKLRHAQSAQCRVHPCQAVSRVPAVIFGCAGTTL